MFLPGRILVQLGVHGCGGAGTGVLGNRLVGGLQVGRTVGQLDAVFVSGIQVLAQDINRGHTLTHYGNGLHEVNGVVFSTDNQSAAIDGQLHVVARLGRTVTQVGLVGVGLDFDRTTGDLGHVVGSGAVIVVAGGGTHPLSSGQVAYGDGGFTGSTNGGDGTGSQLIELGVFQTDIQGLTDDVVVDVRAAVGATTRLYTAVLGAVTGQRHFGRGDVTNGLAVQGANGEVVGTGDAVRQLHRVDRQRSQGQGDGQEDLLFHDFTFLVGLCELHGW